MGWDSRPKQGPSKMRSSRAKKDDSVMGTNDSSILSKRSVWKLYYSHEPDFYEPFVTKFQRRNPLINRGYWLRMFAVEHVIRQFLARDDGNPKIVVNLGCGYDPTPFQFGHQHPSLCEGATFVDVDYPQLIERKKAMISRSPLLQSELTGWTLHPSAAPIHIKTDRYLAIGCDLRNLDFLEKILSSELPLSSSSILFVAEVSITYMNVPNADAIIRWASTLSNAEFCLLEQYLPDGPDHPFAQTMLSHFNKLQTPIHAVGKYPRLSDQESRFRSCGWPAFRGIRNLWDLWSDTSIISAEERQHLDEIEPFDEWEEFALFAGHYFLIVATNASCKEETTRPRDPEDTRNPTTRDAVHIDYQFLGSEEGIIPTPRRFGAAFTLGPDTVAVHGGQSIQNRLASMDVLTKSKSNERIQPPCTLPRVCHTITTIGEGSALLVGGRTSPSRCMADCWLLRNGVWTQVQDTEPARFRHSAAKIVVTSSGASTNAVLIFGGKTGNGQTRDDWKVWTRTDGWRDLKINGTGPSARFGASICSTGDSRGFLMGGADSMGTVLRDIWEWEIDDSEMELTFTERTSDIIPDSNQTYPRMGATLLPFEDDFLLIGGIPGTHLLRFEDEILLLRRGSRLVFEPVTYTGSPKRRLLLVGSGAAALSRNEVIISGGGAVCFSMGSFWNGDSILLTKCNSISKESWTTMVAEPQSNSVPVAWKMSWLTEKKMTDGETTRSEPEADPTTTKSDKREDAAADHIGDMVPRTRIHDATDFDRIVAASRPVIIEGLDLGPCSNKWTTDYLKEKVGADREIVVHVCDEEKMTFQNKNFSYTRTTFGEFIGGIVKGERMYLRAASASQPAKTPTKLEEDFPSIAADFFLPEPLSMVDENLHSSPLRISGPVSLWLHYDVLANVLCQITGSKSLRLYPPGDVRYLGFPPGGSSSNTDVFAAESPNLRHTHPLTAHLNSGDILFIPPMWSHTATPEDGVSVAVNVFFRNLSSGYAAGKDVYGNRDLQAYEHGRRDIERIIRAFRDIPDDIAKFYLDRLAEELRAKAERYGS